MAEKKIFEILNELKAELKKPLSAEDKKRVKGIVRDMENYLRNVNAREKKDHGKNVSQLKSGMDHFKETHPELSLNIGRIMDLLNQMGI